MCAGVCRLDIPFGQAWAPEFCCGLVWLDLSNNALRTLKDQGLGYLKVLTFLDLRANALPSLSEAVLELSKCGRLTTLFLKVYGVPNSYVPATALRCFVVFCNLFGVLLHAFCFSRADSCTPCPFHLDSHVSGVMARLACKHTEAAQWLCRCMPG